MSLDLSRSEQAAVYAALVPGFRADRKRYSTSYRGGDSPDALSVDLERGWYDFAIGEGGDCIAFLQRARQCDFRGAVRWISNLIGRDLLMHRPPQPKRPKYSERDLCRAELLAVGLAWRVSRAVEAATAELWGPRHEEAAAAVRMLTEWQERIRSWRNLRLNGPEKDPRSYHENVWTAKGQQEAIELMQKLPSGLVRECVAEAQQTYDSLANIVCGLEHAA